MGEVVQFRDYGHQPAKRVNAAADRAFWMGRTGMDGKGTMLTGPVADSLTMGSADPKMEYEAPSGDCA